MKFCFKFSRRRPTPYVVKLLCLADRPRQKNFLWNFAYRVGELRTMPLRRIPSSVWNNNWTTLPSSTHLSNSAGIRHNNTSTIFYFPSYLWNIIRNLPICLKFNCYWASRRNSSAITTESKQYSSPSIIQNDFYGNSSQWVRAIWLKTTLDHPRISLTLTTGCNTDTTSCIDTGSRHMEI